VKKLIVIVLAALTALLAGLAQTQPASASTPRHILSAPVGYLEPGMMYRPHDLMFSGDSTLWMTGVHWHWTATRAVGHGIAGVNSCNPDCATGSVAYVPARVVESRPVTVKLRVFTRTGSSSIRSVRVFRRYEIDYRWRPFGTESRVFVRQWNRGFTSFWQR
jgi:hypothetical protein